MWREERRARMRGGAPSDARRLDLLPGMIARAHEGTRFHVAITHLATGFTELCELLRCVVPVERVVIRRGAEILSEREDVDVHVAKLSHRLQYLGNGFAHAEDESRLGRNVGCDALRHAKDLEHALVATAGTATLEEARHSFGVVVVDLRLG